MTFNLQGQSQTINFASSTVDGEGPYINTGGQNKAATLGLATAYAGVVVTEEAGAIDDSIGNEIALTLSGPGVFLFEGGDPYRGVTTFENGATVEFDNANAFGAGGMAFASGSATDTLVAEASFSLDNSITVDSGSSAVIAAASTATLNLIGNVTIDAGARLRLGAAGASGAVNVEDGTLVDNGELIVDAAATSALYLATLSGSGELTVDGPGTFTLKGAGIGFTGDIVIEQGTLVLTHAASEEATSIVFSGASGALFADDTLIVQGNSVVVDPGASASIGAAAGDTMTLGNIFDDLGGAATTLHFGSSSATGVIDFGSAEPAYVATGAALSIDGGTVQLENANIAGALKDFTGGFTIASGSTAATFDLNGESVEITDLSGGSVGRIANSGAAAVLDVFETAATTYAGGTVSGGGALTLEVSGSAGGDLTLSGVNTFAGGVTVESNGTLSIAAENAIGTGNLALNPDATLNLTGAATLFASASDATLNLAASAKLTLTGSGGNTIDMGSQDALTLADAGSEDVVNGSHGTLAMNGVDTDVVGGANTVSLQGTGNILFLGGTLGAWDGVTGSNAEITLNGAQASVTGGGDTVTFFSSGDQASLYKTNGAWDALSGSNATAILNSAQASVSGGADTLYLNGASSISLYKTNGAWDAVSGSNATAILNGAQASVSGGGDALYLNGASSVSLGATNGNWDTVNGSSATEIFTSAQAASVGGGDTLYLNGASTVSLYSTNNNWDAVYGSNQSEILNSAQATLVGNSNAIYLGGDNALTLSGSSEQIVTGKALGEDWITGFGSSDKMQYSAADFASFAVLQAHMSQSGSNTIITLDASDAITLYNVQASSLQSSQFSFV